MSVMATANLTRDEIGRPKLPAADIQVNAGVPPASTSAAPKMVDVEGALVPEVPADLASTGVDESVLCNLALKLANTMPQFSTEWAARELKLPLQLAEQLYWK